MGYMGFGMNSYAYKRKPRKPFSKSKISSFIGLQHYSRSFKLQLSKNENKKLTGLKTILIVGLICNFYDGKKFFKLQ